MINKFFKGVIDEPKILEKEKSKAITPFFWIKQITVDKNEWSSFSETEKKVFNPFLIHKALSYNKYYLPIVEIAMAYPMPNDKLYDFYKDVIPQKQMFNKWVKSNIQWDEEEIKALAQYFECGTHEVKDFYTLLDLKDKSIILNEIKGFESKKKVKKKK
jgi:hypothetical protein